MKPSETIKKLNFFNRYYIELERPCEKLVEEKQKNRAEKWFSKKEMDKNSQEAPFTLEENGRVIFI